MRCIVFLVQIAYNDSASRKGMISWLELQQTSASEWTADLKAQADALFSELGMNLTTAFNIFVRQSIREGGIPFEISINQPNKETIAAMLEGGKDCERPVCKGL